MMATPTAIGSVMSLCRYPVKSMLGETLNDAEITERGLLGDRAYALIDASDGKVASAKHPRKWSQLLACRATFVDTPRPSEPLPQVRITLPDNSTVTSAARDCNTILSRVLSRDVTLQSAGLEAPTLELYWPDIDGLVLRETVRDLSLPERTFFDVAPIHVLTTATLDRLSDLYPQGRFEVQRFRPNIVIEPTSKSQEFIENAWIEQTLVIGETVRLRVTGTCYRCVMTTLAQGDLPQDQAILRTVAQHNEANAGAYATVLQGGTICCGDAVRIE